MQNNIDKETITVIKAKNSLLSVNIKEVWQYRELIFLFVKRNYVTRYKQTILGPAWILLNPLLSTILYSVVFTGVAKLPTDGVPALAFYMAGNIIWACFAACLQQTASTFLSNTAIMGKVYFPRLVMPISTILTSICDFFIQLLLLAGVLGILVIRGNVFHCTVWLLAIPVVILQISLLGLGFGIIISSLTTRYRDLIVLVGFGTQLWMYASPVVYSISLIPEKFQSVYMLNPVTPCIIIFRHAFFGNGKVPYLAWGISWIVTIIILFLGIIIFNKIEKTFMDTV